VGPARERSPRVPRAPQAVRALARIVAVVPDLMFGSRVEATLGAAGHEVELASAPGAADLGAADLVIVDLGEIDPGALADSGAPVLGFYSHVDVETRERAESAGVDLIVPRSRMAREMPALVESLLTRSG
jgi:hypothetical protein